MRRRLAVFSAAAVLLLAPGSASAGSPTEELQAFFTATARILDPRSSEAAETRLDAIRAMVREIVDVPGAAQLALGRSWSARTPQEIDDFVPLFAEFLEQSLISGIAARIRLADGVQIRYLDEAVDDARATVSTTILNRRGVELSFDYRMVERRGRWAIRDVVIDGVSLAGNYRAQFARVIQGSSFPELVRQLRARVGASTPVLARAPETIRAIGPIAAIGPIEAIRPRTITADPGTARAADAGAEPERAEIGSEPTPLDARFETDVTLTTAVAGTAGAEGPMADAPGADAPAVDAPVLDLPASPARVAADRPPITASPPPSAPAPPERAYWVQIGAFRSEQSARRVASLVSSEERATTSPSSVVVQPATLDVPLSRVRIGPFTERSEAAAKLREMHALGFEPFIAEQRN